MKHMRRSRITVSRKCQELARVHKETPTFKATETNEQKRTSMTWELSTQERLRRVDGIKTRRTAGALFSDNQNEKKKKKITLGGF